jgi:hypothetical protein
LGAYEIDAAIQRGPYPRDAATFDVLVRSEDVEAALKILGPEETFGD